MEVNRKPQPNETVDKDGRVIYKFKENELSIGKFEVTQAQWQAVMRTTQKQLSEAARRAEKRSASARTSPCTTSRRNRRRNSAHV